MILVGISHKTAPIKVRERFSFTGKQLQEILLDFKKMELLLGAVILSTCNRTEFYVDALDNQCGLGLMKRFLFDYFRVGEPEISRYFYIRQDLGAVRHIFRVAAGLDSQVLGEPQILEQVKSALRIAREENASSDLLNEVFGQAVCTGKKVRSETRISQGNVSIASLAIKIIAEKTQALVNKQVLIIGTGKISALVSGYLQKKGIKGIFVSNRTYAKALKSALDCQGQAINFSQLKEKLKIVDIVISSTASPHLILKKEMLAEIMRTRDKPLLIIDLALPRDIDPQARNIPGIYLYDLDDLKTAVEGNYHKRIEEVRLSEEIIQRELGNFTACFPIEYSKLLF